MKVGDRQQSILDPRLGGPGAVEAAPSAPAGESGQADQVHVSDVARALTRLMAQASAAEPARAAQVTALRSAVERGQYAPDLHNVARDFLTEVFGPLAAA